MKKLLILLLLSQSILAQTILKAEALQNDFEILRRSYEQMHPGLYKYQSKETIDFAFETCKKALSKDQTLSEAYLHIHQLTASFRCGHSYPNFFNQEGFLKKEVFEQKNALPFHFKIIDDRMIVVRSADSTIKKGVEIKSINGNKVSKIINIILPVVRADGSNDAKRKSLLENGKEYFSYFDIFFPIFFQVKNNLFTLEVYDFDSKKRTKVNILAVNHAERDKVIQAKYQEPVYKKMTFSWLDNETAVMTINDFNNYNGKTDYNKFYLESLQDYIQKKGKNLIIDVRKNEGGNSSEMFKLVQYFTEKPIEYVELQNTWQMLKIDSTLKPYVTNSDWAKWWFNQSEKGFQKTSLGQWKSKGAENPQIFKPNAERFSGNIFLLSSATNSSATYMMVETFKKHKLATIVGQTTGGNQKGVTSSAFFFMLLPNSKIEVDVPLIGTDLAVAQNLPDAGIEPDVFVKPSIADLIKGVDTEMKTVNELIKRK
ncbi:S41 family peptidase [Emticicia oligotrophica]|uniref:S41 family peptidase n=1 Tax=Emticicia oligotrophica TaxID=312279 RepID=UPI00273C14D4|nr:S41 family peptidase [Emticicia oligotrophica]